MNDQLLVTVRDALGRTTHQGVCDTDFWRAMGARGGRLEIRADSMDDDVNRMLRISIVRIGPDDPLREA